MIKDSISLNEMIFTLLLVSIVSTVDSFLSSFAITKLNQRKIKKFEAEFEKMNILINN